MSFELMGRLIEISETEQISDRFKKREFVLETQEMSGDREFIETIKFQLTQDRCSLLDSIPQESEIRVHFNIRGRRWEKEGRVSYFNNLEAWRIEQVDNTSQEVPPAAEGGSGDSFMEEPPEFPQSSDDLPF